MTFRNPQGLWILLAIPVVITLFLLHRKYRDVLLPSNHIWRMLQKKQKANRLKSRFWQYVMLLLQILSIASLALLASQPLFRFGQPENRIYILDTSASMRMVSADGTSRFDRAREAILRDTAQQSGGSTYTLLCTDPKEPLLLERTGSRSELSNGLNAAECSWVEQQPDHALTLCREMLRSLPSAAVCFYTDHNGTGTGITVINVSNGETNAAVIELKETHAEIGRCFASTVVSYGSDASLTLALYVDDGLTSAQNIVCPAGKPVCAVWSLPQLQDYTSVRVWITQDDALIDDNEATLFNRQAYEAKTALVSASPFYWQKALSALDGVSVNVFSPADAPQSGYDLYIYDSTLPTTLPDDGMCLMVAPDAPHPETELTFGDWKNGGFLSGNNTNPLLADMRCGSIAVQTYRQVTDSADAEKLLFRSTDPVYLRGTTQDGRSYGYLMFSLKESNLPMLPDFILMLKHLVRDICPILCPVSQPKAGCETVLYPLHNCTGLRGVAPDESVFSLAYDQDAAFTAHLPGVYTLTQYSTRGTMESKVQVGIPDTESDSRITSAAWSLPEASGSHEQSGHAGMSLQTLWAALFIILMLMEGLVYRHERI